MGQLWRTSHGGDGSPQRLAASWQSCFQVDIGEEEAETLESIDPHWRATRWLQVVVQSIAIEEVPWYELVIPLTSGAEGVALSLAKHLLTAWRWSIKVCGENACPPTPTILNIRQFMTEEEVAEGVGEPHWFMAYSRALQWVGEAAHGQKWKWPMRETLEVKVSLLMHAFREETGVDLTVACIKLCWEPAPRTLYHKRENVPTAHVITFLDELMVRVPSLDTWDQLVWPPAEAIPWALTEAELYGYCCGQVVDLGPMMPVAQFWVTDEGGAYLCIARGVSWHITQPRTKQSGFQCVASPMILPGPGRGLPWPYVPCIPEEVAWITRLGAH